MENSENAQKYYCRQTLLDRGWTDSLIRKFLVKEDATRRNPRYKCASPMKLYEIQRVLSAESTEDFKLELEKSRKRSEKMVERMDAKREALLEYAMSVEISLPDIPYETVLEKAIQSYNEFHYNDDRFADTGSDKEFLKRICINYLRHECTIYEEELDKIFGEVGVHEAHDLLQSRINEAIRAKYKELA